MSFPLRFFARAILSTTVLGMAVPAFAAEPGRRSTKFQDACDARIEIVRADHPDDGRLDQIRIVCKDGHDSLDLGIPRRWVSFLIKHMDAEIEIDDDGIDLELLWQAVEDLRPGEEIRIVENGGGELRIWLE